MGWRCPVCGELNSDDHHWCKSCSPLVIKPEPEIVERTDESCRSCGGEIDPGMAYIVLGPRHIKCSR